MKKKILPILIVIICLLGIFAVYLIKNNKTNSSASMVDSVETPEATDASSIEPKEVLFTGILDMENWKYNLNDGVYYQTGIPYAQSSPASSYQKIALFVPEKYLRCDKQTGERYSCVPNMAALVGKYTVRTAPIVSVINSPDYKAKQALSEYQSFKEFTDAGFIYAHIGFRGIEAGAPAGVTDIKAAVRFIKYNSERIPGNTDSIYLLAANDGSVLAATVAASGNDRSYQPYLQQIGALNNSSDSIKGVMLINPISGLDTANEAVEWFFSSNRQGRNEQQKKISERMAKEYADYINRAGFIGPKKEALTLQYTPGGVYQDGTYYDYIKSIIIASLEEFFARNQFPYRIPSSWEITEESAVKQDSIKLTGVYKSREKFFSALNAKKTWIIDRSAIGIEMSSIKDFLNAFRHKQLPMAYFDNFKKDTAENILFSTDNQGIHFDEYTAKIFKNTSQGQEAENDLYKRDNQGNTTTMRVNMYNPLYYLISSYDGYKTTTVAPFWRIKAGLFQTTAILPSSINLFLAVKNYPGVPNVDYEAVWGMGDIGEISKKDKLEFVEWINKH